MRIVAATTARRQAGILAQMPAWIGRRQRELSDPVYAAGDAAARQHGWTVTATTGRFGFGGRSYRDPRFDNRRQQLSLSGQDAAMPPVRRRSGRPENQRGSVGPIPRPLLSGKPGSADYD
jgi:hypothetical protein